MFRVMSSETQQYLASQVAVHAMKLLHQPVPPDLPAELAPIPGLPELHAGLLALRKHLVHVSQGDLSHNVDFRGYVAGLLKTHLANLRHLTWQVEQVSQGDFSQRVQFMGEFSTAFNKMAQQLDSTLSELKDTEAALTQLTDSLREEVAMRTAAVDSLRQSEARFKYLADHDPLTGAMNRRSFLMVADIGLETAHHKGTPCCVAMMDVDHFKRFNDTYGHVNGDLALKHVVQIGLATLRNSDSMGRYGGEEFIFFFADADLETGEAIAERIRAGIAGAPVETSMGLAPLTVSMGVSVILPEWRNKDRDIMPAIISMADAALYQAKQNGRNQVRKAPLQHPDLFAVAKSAFAEDATGNATEDATDEAGNPSAPDAPGSPCQGERTES